MKKIIKNKNIRVVVGMSGGVDSSVVAALLKEAGFDVVGIFMKFWRSPELVEGKDSQNRCCSVESEKLARMVAKEIGIPFYVLNVEKEFKKKVVDYFLKEYKAGNTPNPCVVCNKEIKFGFLIKKALSLGADFVATGHYARISVIPSLTGNPEKVENNLDSRFRGNDKRQFKLLKGEDKNKDQSYFLWQLDQKQLSHILFPVGGYTKPEVRKLAKKFKLPTAETPESQEICFVSDNVNNFLKKYLKIKPGRILDKTLRCGSGHAGKILGEHNGLWFYTIGQRRGLEIPQGPAYAKASAGKPFFVVDKDFEKNELVVSKNKKDLEKTELIAKDVSWISGKEPKLPLKVKVKIRYRHKLSSASILKISNFKLKIRFDKPQQAITPGQSVVFYLPSEILQGKTWEGEGKELLGGATIDTSIGF